MGGAKFAFCTIGSSITDNKKESPIFVRALTEGLENIGADNRNALIRNKIKRKTESCCEDIVHNNIPFTGSLT